MIHRCEKCPGTEPLKMFLFDALEKEDGDVCFQQWQATDSTKLLSQPLNICDFVDLVVEAIDSLTTNSFSAKSQARYLKKRKEELLEDSAIVLGDFAENYSFVVQDEVQSFHWSKQSCALHPLVVYVRENGELIQKSFCAVSDDLEHDSSLVHQIQKEISQQIKSNIPQVTKVEYFSDGCTPQYKNCKNFLNLKFHHQDFGLSANWSFLLRATESRHVMVLEEQLRDWWQEQACKGHTQTRFYRLDLCLIFAIKALLTSPFYSFQKKKWFQSEKNLKIGIPRLQPSLGHEAFIFVKPNRPYEIAYKRTSDDENVTRKNIVL